MDWKFELSSGRWWFWAELDSTDLSWAHSCIYSKAVGWLGWLAADSLVWGGPVPGASFHMVSYADSSSFGPLIIAMFQRSGLGSLLYLYSPR